MPSNPTARRGRQPTYPKLFRFSWKRSHLVLLVLLTLMGFYLRVEPVISDSVHFSYDQGIDLFHVRRLVAEHKISLIGRHTGLEGVFMGPFWTWLLAIPYVVSGGDPAANVLFFSVIGVLSIWLAYVLTRRMFSETVAFLVAVYVSLSPPFLAASHIILSPYPLTLLMIPYLWILWEIIENRRDGLLPYLGLLAGLFFQFEIGYAVFSLLATLAVLIAFASFPRRLKRSHLYGMLFFLLPFLPQILFEFRHGFLMSNALLGLFTGEQTSLGSEGVSLSGRFLIRAGSLWEDYSSVVAFKGKDEVLTALVTVPSLLGWIVLARDRVMGSIRFGAALTLFVVVMYGGFALYPGPVWVWYRVGLPAVFVLTLVIGLARFTRERAWMKWVGAGAVLTVVLVGTNPKSYFIRPTDRFVGGVSTLRIQKQTLDTIFLDAGDQPFDLYVYTPPIYPYAWDHLIIWYARSKYSNLPQEYGYQRSDGATNDFYLLIEPDEIQGRINGWKGNFAKEGALMKAWETPEGIRIEKWQAQHD